MLHAGLDGIEKGYEIPEPMETNLYDLSHDEREAERGIEQLPETLGRGDRGAGRVGAACAGRSATTSSSATWS